MQGRVVNRIDFNENNLFTVGKLSLFFEAPKPFLNRCEMVQILGVTNKEVWKSLQDCKRRMREATVHRKELEEKIRILLSKKQHIQTKLEELLLSLNDDLH